MILAIDPGADTGWAILQGNRIHIGEGLPPQFEKIVVIEKPEFYPGSKVAPNRLSQLSIKVGELTSLALTWGAQVHHCYPKNWKGQMSKETSNNRTLRSLQQREDWKEIEASLKKTPASRRHNLLDAAGLLLWAIGKDLEQYKYNSVYFKELR